VKNRWFTVVFLLLVSGVIYLLYRTEKTAVTTLAASLIGTPVLKTLRLTAQRRCPLPSFVVYTLPEMLWTAAFTLLSGPFYLRLFGKRIACFWIPLLVASGLELLQLLPDFPGRFDWADLLGAIVSWAAIVWMSGMATPSQNLIGRLNRERLAFTGCYAIMYLAHVWR
jgi:hypothetical protein